MSELDIKYLRQKLGVTQKELAKMVGVSENTIQNWEYGRRIPSTKHQILCSLLPNNTSSVGSSRPISEISDLSKALDEISEMRKLVQEQVRYNQEQFDRLMRVIESMQKIAD